ncbi:MAG: HAD hydrolase-like protein [Spirochaetaceae bacterium]|nr:MAG: HAD hydrolase-like protein [Spirochaetaceae bacterium]
MSGDITYLLFDLDETLYPPSSGMVEEISRRMTTYVSRYLNLDATAAARLRRQLSQKHGTTLTGLMKEHDFKDPESYLEFAHPTNVHRYLQKDPELIAALRSVTLPKAILTNAPVEHARRILEYLEIDGFFERIFDIRINDFRGKPERAVYLHVLTELKRKASEVLFIDNRLDYLIAFREIGGKVLWVAEGDAETSPDHEVPRIASIKELPAFLENI